MADRAALDELSEIARALRAQLEWQRSAGTFGLPAASSLPPRPEVAPAPDRLPVEPVAAREPVLARELAPAALVAPARAPAAPVAPARAPAAPVAPALEPGLGALPLEERRRRLELLNEAVKGCTRCALHEKRTQTVFARGDGSSGLCFVGEGPGADEDAQGYPFVGAAGQLLDRMIGAMGFSRDEVYVCNIVKCRPPNNRKPEPVEMSTCMPYLQEQLELLQPSVIVALGATAVQGLLGTTEGIMRLRGKWKLYKGRIAVMPTFHPAYLLRTPNAKREVWEDLQAVVRQMGRSLPARS
jgi:DNA polymerase